MMETGTQEPSQEELLFQELFDSIMATAKETKFERHELDDRFVDKRGEFYDDLEVRYPGHEFEENLYGKPCAILLPLERPYPREIVHIAVDQLSRHYGGPEEGGWWYDVGRVDARFFVLVVYDENEDPQIPDIERAFLKQLAVDLTKEYGSFDTNRRSSMAPRAGDFSLRTTLSEPQDWSDYRPYC